MITELNAFVPPTLGWLSMKLDPIVIKRLNKYVKESKIKWNHTLAGNINKSSYLEDTDEWFWKNVLSPCTTEYLKRFGNKILPKILNKNCEFFLNSFWVNFQKKYEFNPLHNHGGVFSFVIWLKIPFNTKKEKNLPFVKHANVSKAADFEFNYTDLLGDITSWSYAIDKKSEGRMLFFPSKLQHQVYPFYTSNKDRVSVSGNICLNVDKIIK
jgi:hypothetical protein